MKGKHFVSAILSLRLVMMFAMLIALWARNASAQFPPNQEHSAAFTGDWCTQGDLAKRALIVDNGAFLNLTNEKGDNSTGQYQGQNSIVAPEWQWVTGTLSPDRRQINWSNGTFWTRCTPGAVGRRLNLTGIWFAQGNHSQSCSIHQRGNDLQLSNQSGGNASGLITGRRQLTTNWDGTILGGTVTANGNRIDWDDGTYWTRYRLYGRTINSQDAIE